MTPDAAPADFLKYVASEIEMKCDHIAFKKIIL